MAGLLILALVVLFCVLAPFVGVDSRIPDDRDPRGWWPGRRTSR
jgi:hypothetical protein